MRSIAVFCDFDGTVTETDNIIAIMKYFNPPGWIQLKDAILTQKISVREGVGLMFSLLPSSLKKEIIQFALHNAKIRAGFADFIDFLKQERIPLYIVSGGIDFFVHSILEPFVPIADIFCNGSDFSKESIEILWPHSCDSNCDHDCGCCKPSIIRALDGDELYKIVIGDSITDLQAAIQADFVLARDLLLEKCQEFDIPHRPFISFYDCMKEIQTKLEVVR